MSVAALFRRSSDQRGTAITEFGLIAPVFLLLMLGALDLAHTLYMQGVLQGVVQKAARDSTLESAQEETTQLAINQKIGDQVKRLAANADVSISRRNFYRSEEHTSELQSLMRISYAVFCLKKKTKTTRKHSLSIDADTT